ncbi:MAG: type I DNA topoisomerase [Desulfobacteraceae bacterium]|jgi:DNA topoisomerase-1
MTKNLLIVESPTKARTLKKYLGTDYQIMASVGHIKDLPNSRLGVDTENDFTPEYVTIKGKGKILSGLKKASKGAEAIYLAPDPDREGEAIAWHIAQELGTGEKKIFRILFNELTGKAIKESLSSPQNLNQDRFESQQTRRILDRLVGYQISPLLWSKVRRGLSAGRVQSVALRMICEREREIHAFQPQEYWTLTAHLQTEEPPPFKARLFKYDNEKADLKNEEQTQAVVAQLKDETFQVEKVARKEKKKTCPPPFTTSLLQQEAYRKLHFPAKKTMSIAQNLYEGIELGEKGQIGLITYMRTDSFRLSSEAVSEAREFINKAFGQDYLPEKPNTFRSRKGAQEAHEAIRPTSVTLSPEEVAVYLTKDQLALYTLIWKRFLACQMNPAIMEQTQADVSSGPALFRATGSVVIFKGFTVLYEESLNESETSKNKQDILPPLKKGQALKLIELDPAQHFTQPPPRFTEATLIKALEENGIGRPSTYASILGNIHEREYVSLTKGRFSPTELGFLVTDLLVKSFPEILDIAFTAQMESNLDRIERGEVKWTKVLDSFYRSFGKDLEMAKKKMKGEVMTDLPCPECQKPLAIKSGRNGLFLGCSGFPECKYTNNFSRDEKGNIVVESSPDLGKEEGTCEVCGRPMVVKSGKFGTFLACSGYPECKQTRAWVKGEGPVSEGKPTEITCKKCGGKMVVRQSRTGQKFLACDNYPRCRHTESLSTNVPCPEEDCPGKLVERASKKGRRFYGCDQYPRCRFALWDEPINETCPECGTKVLLIKRTKGSGPVIKCRKKGCGFTRPLDDA